MTKRQVTVITILSIAAMVLIALISQRLWFRLDLTKNKSYTISPISRNLYTEIPDQVHITYYLSEKLSSIHPVPGEIEDLLREYAAYSRGRIRLTVRDPAKAGRLEEVQQLGIIPQQIQIVERDQANFAMVYSGITIEYLDKIEVIPFAFNLETMEYDLTTRIRTLVRGTVREAGVILGDSGKRWTEDFAIFNSVFTSSGFNIRLIVPGEEIADTIPVLFVFGGVEEIDDWTLYQIDRYIQGGGKVLFALEGVSLDTNNLQGGRVLNDQGLLSMVSSYGATVKPELVFDPPGLNISYQTVNASGMRIYRILQYPLWIGISDQNRNTTHPVTSGFNGVDLYWASPLELNPPEGVEAVPLFFTSPEAWVQTREFIADPERAYLFDREAADTRGTKIVGAALSGKFPSRFAGSAKPVREGSAEELPDMPLETKESRIIVISDTDMATGMVQYTRSDRNFDFLLKAADWLSNEDDIISIRNRSSQTGRLDKISDPEKRLQAMAFARIFNVMIIPLGIIILGILRSLQRHRSLKAVNGKEKESSDGV
jgi:gliding-associated putative ABC transporter substrate-binding component GldG